MEEIWIDIKGYEGLYQVSNLGRVKSLERIASQGKRGQRSIGEKIKTPRPNKKGYLKVMLSKDNIQKGYFVHRLVGIAFLENKDMKPQINHKDGDVTNNCVNNLEWSTQSENMQHAFKKLNRQSPNKGKHLTEEWKQHIGEGNKGKTRGKGRSGSEETREKLRKANTGKKATEEMRKKLNDKESEND